MLDSAGLFTSKLTWMSAGALLAALMAGNASAAGATVEQKSALALIDHGTIAMRTDPEASKREAEQALAMLSQRPDADLEIRARLLLCDYYSERDGAAAQVQITAANALLARAQRKGLRAGVLTCQGETLETVGDTVHAAADFDAAVAVATAAKDDQMLAEALFSRGYLRALQGEYAAGMGDARRSQQLFERINMPQHALTVLNAIATIYNRMGDYTQAADIYERAVREQHAAGLRRDEVASLYNLGRARQNLGQWDAARTGFSRCLELSKELKYTRGVAHALLGLALVDSATGHPADALGTLARAAELQRQTPEVRLNAQIQLARGTVLRQLQRGAEALAALGQAEAAFKEAKSLDELADTYDELAAVHAQMGDWHRAYDYRSDAQSTAEKLLHNQLDQRFATLKVEFDTATKERENALLLSENAINQKALAEERRARALQTIVIVLSLLLLGLLTMMVFRQRHGTRNMRTLAMTDELTGAPNRRAVLNHLDEVLRRGDGAPCSILIIDIDHFKSINDRHGHLAGDEILRLLTAKLRQAVTEPAFLGRLGGEEFVVVLPGTSLQDAYCAADQIRASVASVELASWMSERPLTVSIGVTASNAADTVNSMLRRADAALYAAKHAGRNCVRTDLSADSAIAWCETRSA